MADLAQAILLRASPDESAESIVARRSLRAVLVLAKVGPRGTHPS